MASSSSSSTAAVDAGGDDERIEGFFRRRAAAAASAAAAHASASSAAPPPSALLSVRRERAPVAPAQQPPQPQLALLDLALDRSLAALLFACGDALEPRADTRELLRAMALQHLETLTHLSLDAAAAGGGSGGGGSGGGGSGGGGGAPGGGHSLEPAHVVAALREAGHGHAEAARRVERGAARRRELDRLLRIDLGRGEEEQCFSRRKEEQPADVTSAGAAAQLRVELARRAALDALIADGAVEAVAEGAQEAFRARRDAERAAAAASSAAAGARKRGRGSGNEDEDEDGEDGGEEEDEEDEATRSARELAEARDETAALRERLAKASGGAAAAVERQLAAAEARLQKAEARARR